MWLPFGFPSNQPSKKGHTNAECRKKSVRGFGVPKDSENNGLLYLQKGRPPNHRRPFEKCKYRKYVSLSIKPILPPVQPILQPAQSNHPHLPNLFRRLQSPKPSRNPPNPPNPRRNLGFTAPKPSQTLAQPKPPNPAPGASPGRNLSSA